MIDDESKKFIKDTIENAIDKKLDENTKKSDYKKRIDTIKTEQKSIQDRKELLAELQSMNKKGETTVAQKFEILKLSLDTAIPKDFKDAIKTATPSIKKGASQIGKGFSKLTEKAMMLNPITAFLYQNRDVFGSIVDIGSGALKMGWGGLKGTAHGALGLVNSAKNLFKKPGEDTSKEETDITSVKPLPLGTSQSATTQIFQQKEDWKQKIDEVHEVVTKGIITEQKKSSQNLFKGLKSLNSTMDVVKEGVGAITTKQKLIAGGLLLGVVTLVGLFNWIKSGGFSKLLQQFGDEISKKFASKEGKKAREKADTYLQGELQKINVDAENTQNMLNQMDLKKEADFSKAVYITKPGKNINTLRSDDLQNSLQKENVDQRTLRNINSVTQFGTVSAQSRKLNISKTTPLKFPFRTFIAGNGIMAGKDKDHVDFLLTRSKPDKTNAYLLFTNALKSSVKSSYFSANEVIAQLDIDSRIIGDLENFLGTEDNKSLTEAIKEDRSKSILKNTNKIMDQPYHTKGITDALSRQADKNLGVFKEYTEEDLNPQSKISENNTEEKSSNKTPSVSENKLSSISTNPQKAQTQNETLNKKSDLENNNQKIATKENNTTNSQEKIAYINVNQNSNDYKFADNNLTQGEYHDMIDNINTSGVYYG